MVSGLENGPQYPANEGSKISGDPASGVVEPGTAGGLATGSPSGGVSDQASSDGSTITGRLNGEQDLSHWRDSP